MFFQIHLYATTILFNNSLLQAQLHIVVSGVLLFILYCLYRNKRLDALGHCLQKRESMESKGYVRVISRTNRFDYLINIAESSWKRGTLHRLLRALGEAHIQQYTSFG